MKCVEEDYLQWIFLQLCLQWHLGCDLLQNFSLCLSLSAFFLLTTAILEQLLISKASSLYQADRELLAWYRGGVWRGSSEINCWALVHMEYLQLSTETVYIQTSFVPGNIFSPPSVDFCLTRNSQQASANLSFMLVPWERKREKILPSPWLLCGDKSFLLTLPLFLHPLFLHESRRRTSHWDTEAITVGADKARVRREVMEAETMYF